MKELKIVMRAVVECPICHRVIFDGETNPADLVCEHVRLIFSDMAGEVVYVGKGMMRVAQKINSLLAMEEGIEEVMEQAAKKVGGEVYTHTTSGLACGPVSNTNFYIIG
jgi:hypothetical protein